MTVSSLESSVLLVGDGVTVEFPFSFGVITATHVKVAYVVNGLLQTVAPADYAIALNPSSLGGFVTFDVAPANAQKIYIYRETEETQLIGLTSQLKYDPKVVEKVWDKLTFLVQELKTQLTRAVLVAPEEDTEGLLAELYQIVADVAADAAVADQAAGALAMIVDRASHSFLLTIDNAGRGPYALPYDPANATIVDLTVNGLAQYHLDHYSIVVMPAAASGKGVLFLEDQFVGGRVDVRFAFPVGYDPLLNVAQDYATLDAFKAAVTAGLTAANGHSVTAGGVRYVAEVGAVLANLPLGWRQAGYVFTRAQVEAWATAFQAGSQYIVVNEDGYYVAYERDPTGASTDLTTVYGEAFIKRGLGATDLATLAADVANSIRQNAVSGIGVYGGTANAFTLTVGSGYAVIPTRYTIKFRATATNTGAATVAVDGLPAVALRTVTGVALPAGYIRTDVDTEITFDGTYWIVTRAISWGGTLLPTMEFSTPGTSSFVYGTRQGFWRREGDAVSFHGHIIVTPTKGTASGNVYLDLGFLDELGAAATVIPIYNGNGAGIQPITIEGVAGYPGPAGTLGPVGEMRHDIPGKIRLGHHLLTSGVVSRISFSTANITDGVAITIAFSGSFVVAP